MNYSASLKWLVIIFGIGLSAHCSGSPVEDPNKEIRELISGNEEWCWFTCAGDDRLPKYFSMDIFFHGDGSQWIYFAGKRNEIREWRIGQDGETILSREDFHGPDFKTVALVLRNDQRNINSFEVLGTGTGNTPVLFRRNGSTSGKTDLVPIGVPKGAPSGFKPPRFYIPGYYMQSSDTLVSGVISPDYSAFILARKFGSSGLKSGINDMSSWIQPPNGAAPNLLGPDSKPLKADFLALANRPEDADNKGWLVAVERSTGNYFLYRCTDVTCSLEIQIPFLKMKTKALAVEVPFSGDKGLELRMVDEYDDLYQMERHADGSFSDPERIDAGVKAAVAVRRDPFDQSVHTLYYKGTSLMRYRDPNGCELLACHSDAANISNIFSGKKPTEELSISGADMHAKEVTEKIKIKSRRVNGSGLDRFGHEMPDTLPDVYSPIGEDIRFESLIEPVSRTGGTGVALSQAYRPQNDDDDPVNNRKTWDKFLRALTEAQLLPKVLKQLVYEYVGDIPVHQYLEYIAETYLPRPVPLHYLDEGRDGFHLGHFRHEMDRLAWRPMMEEFRNGWEREVGGQTVVANPVRNIQVRIPVYRPVADRESLRRRVIYREVLRALQDPDHPFQAARANGHFGIPVFDVAIVEHNRILYVTVTGEVRVQRMQLTSADMDSPWVLQVGPFQMQSLNQSSFRRESFRSVLDLFLFFDQRRNSGVTVFPSPIVNFRGGFWGDREEAEFNQDLFYIYVLSNYYYLQMAARDNLGSFTYDNERRRLFHMDHHLGNHLPNQFIIGFNNNGMLSGSPVHVYPPAWLPALTPELLSGSILPGIPTAWRFLKRGDHSSAYYADGNRLYQVMRTGSGEIVILLPSRTVAATRTARGGSSAQGEAYAEEGKEAAEAKEQEVSGPRYTVGQVLPRLDVILPLERQPDGLLSAEDAYRGHRYRFEELSGGRLRVVSRDNRDGSGASCSSSSSGSSSSSSRRLLAAGSDFFDASNCAIGGGPENSVQELSSGQTFLINENGRPAYTRSVAPFSERDRVRTFRFNIGSDENRRDQAASLRFFGRPSVAVQGDDVYLWFTAKKPDGKILILGGKASLTEIRYSQTNTYASNAFLSLDWSAENREASGVDQVSAMVLTDGQWLAYCAIATGSATGKAYVLTRRSNGGTWDLYDNSIRCDGPVAISSFGGVLHVYVVRDGQIHHYQSRSDGLKYRGTIGNFSGDYLYVRSDADGYEVISVDSAEDDNGSSRAVWRNSLDMQTIAVGGWQYRYELKPDGNLMMQCYFQDIPIMSPYPVFQGRYPASTEWTSQFSVTAVADPAYSRVPYYYLVLATVAAEETGGRNVHFFQARMPLSDCQAPILTEMSLNQVMDGPVLRADSHGGNGIALGSNSSRLVLGKSSQLQLLLTREGGSVRSVLLQYGVEDDSYPQTTLNWLDQGAVVKRNSDNEFAPVLNSGSARLSFQPRAYASYFTLGRTKMFLGTLVQQVGEANRPDCTATSENDLCGYASDGRSSWNLVNELSDFSAPEWQANLQLHDNGDFHLFAPTSAGKNLSYHLNRSEAGPGILPVTEELFLPDGTFSCFESILTASSVVNSCLDGGFLPLVPKNETVSLP